MTLEDAYGEAKRFKCQGNRFGENRGGEWISRGCFSEADGQRHVQARVSCGRVVRVLALLASAGPAVMLAIATKRHCATPISIGNWPSHLKAALLFNAIRNMQGVTLKQRASTIVSSH